MLTLVAGLWWFLSQRETTHLRNLVTSEALYLASHVDADLRTRLPALQRIARRWELRGGLSESEFLSDASACLADFQGLLSVQWVDKDLVVRRVVPLEGNERVLGMNSAIDPIRRGALEQAISTRSPKATSAVDLMQGGKGFLVYFPIFVRGEFDGFLLGVFHVRTWLNSIFHIGGHHHLENDFRIAVFLDGKELLKPAEWDASLASGLEGAANAHLLEREMSIRLRPTASFIDNNRTRLPELLAGAAALLAVLMACIVYLLQRALFRNRQIEAAKTDLEKEIGEHSKTMDRLGAALSRLDMATRAGGFGVWTWDVPTGVLSWNERMYELFNITPDVTPTWETFRNAVHPEDVAAVESLMEDALQGKAVFNTEHRIVLPAGDVRYLRSAAQVERDPDGTPRKVTGIDWDTSYRKQAEQALRESEEKFRVLSQSTPTSILLYQDNRWIYANPAAETMTGYELRELLGMNFWDLVHQDDRELVKERGLKRQKGEAAVSDYEIRIVARGGAVKWIQVSAASTHVNGRPAGIVSMNDITGRKRAEEELAVERQRMANILEGTNAGTWEWNIQTGEAIYNARWAQILGYTLGELSPVSIDTWVRLAHPEDLETARGLLDKHFLKELPYYACEMRIRHKDGGWIWVSDRGKVATWTEDGKPLTISGTRQDISARKKAEAQVAHMATHDGLTDLPSLRLANDRLAMALGMARRQRKEGAVLFMDLDGFKQVNDTLGHDAGDHVIRETARRMLSCVRETDTVARVGGDEFLIIAFDLRIPDDASTIAEKILRNVSHPISIQGRQVTVGASIGIAAFPLHGEDKEKLIKLADEAMYRVKSSGKNGYGFAKDFPA